MVAKDKNGSNVEVPGIILDTKNKVRRFSRSIARQEQAKNRTTAFRTSEFKMELYLDSLQNQNAKIELIES